MFTEIIWRFLILETFVMGALCCRCEYEHPQKHFCKSEFVLKVEIQEEIKSSSIPVFRMEIKKVFKGNIWALNLLQNRSVILEMSKLCPIEYLKSGDEFVINGFSKNGIIYTEKCYGNTMWKMTTQFYKYALEKYYKGSCDCYNMTGEYTNDKYCEWNYSFMKRRVGDCKWVNTIIFYFCKYGLLKEYAWD